MYSKLKIVNFAGKIPSKSIFYYRMALIMRRIVHFAEQITHPPPHPLLTPVCEGWGGGGVGVVKHI